MDPPIDVEFESLFRQHQSELYRWIVRLVRNPGVAEELTIETFLRIYRSRERFDTARPFLPWARRIATRIAIDHLRSTEVRGLPREPQRPDDADPAIQAELREQIRRAFVALPARLRVAAQLALIEESPYQEVADALDISLSAAKMRVGRAVALLRKHLDRMGVRP